MARVRPDNLFTVQDTRCAYNKLDLYKSLSDFFFVFKINVKMYLSYKHSSRRSCTSEDEMLTLALSDYFL